VLLEVHKNQEYMHYTSKIMFTDLLIKQWENGGKDEMLNKLISYIE